MFRPKEVETFSTSRKKAPQCPSGDKDGTVEHAITMCQLYDDGLQQTPGSHYRGKILAGSDIADTLGYYSQIVKKL